MNFRNLFRSPELRPDQLNVENQITDRKILGRDRLKFGIGCIMYQSEETGLTPIHTLIVRLLGGTNVHLGIVAGAGSLSSLVQWFGAVFLRKLQSNRKAMNLALGLGILFGLILALALFLYGVRAEWGAAALTIYLIGAYGLAGASGIQMNVESSWIGDLVPRNMLGWFTSVKWIIGSLGVLFFTLLFGQIASWSPYAMTFAIVFLLVAFSHLVAIILMSTVTDREPQSAKLIAESTQKGDKLNFRSSTLWCYIWFYLTWAGGRTALLAFTTAYMLDLGFSMAKITLLIALQAVINLVMLLLVGKFSDQFGTRKPLILISFFIGCSMILWVASAWWGVAALVAYQLINGAAGNTHSMLGINYGLEIFPAKGRAAYIGFSRVFIGLSALAASVVAGFIMNSLVGWQLTLWGVTLNHYHLFFTGCTLFTMSCVIPLLLAGTHKVENA